MSEATKSFAEEILKETGFKPATEASPALPNNPLGEKPQTATTTLPGAAEETKTAEESKAAPTQTTTTTDNKVPADPKLTEEEIEDAKVFARLSKQLGRDIKSYDDIKAPAKKKEPTAEEKKALAEETRGKAIEFGKNSKLFTQTDYDNFMIYSSKDKADVVQEAFVLDAISQDPTLTDEEARELFNLTYHINDSQDSPAYKHYQKMIEKEYEGMKEKRFGKILGIQEQYEKAQELNERAVRYTAKVNAAELKIPTQFEFEIGGEKMSFPIDKNSPALAALKKNYLTLEMLNANDPTGDADVEKIFIEDAIKEAKAELFEKAIAEVAKSYSDAALIKAKLGRKGVLSTDEVVGKEGSGKVVDISKTPNAIKIVEEMTGNKISAVK